MHGVKMSDGMRVSNSFSNRATSPLSCSTSAARDGGVAILDLGLEMQ